MSSGNSFILGSKGQIRNTGSHCHLGPVFPPYIDLPLTLLGDLLPLINGS